MNAPIDFLAPDVPASLPWHETPLVRATDGTLEGYGRLVDDPSDCKVEIVRWPASGKRPVDPGTGDQGGTARRVRILVGGRCHVWSQHRRR